MRWRPEEEAVLLCTLALRGPDQDQRLCELLRSRTLDWSLFWAKAMDQQVHPLVAHTLSGEPFLSALPEVASTTRNVRLWTLRYNAFLEAELHCIAAQLRTRGIPMAPLKGTYLTRRLFDSLEVRRVGDIDIFVQQSYVEEARSALRDMGYEPARDRPTDHTFHGVPWVRQTPTAPVMVEVHWGLSDPDYVSIDYAALWQRILAGGVGDQAWYTLPTEELILFLALHLAKNQAGVLRLLADIDRLVRREEGRIDWPYALERWNVEGLLYFALVRAQTLLGSPAPGWVIQRLRPAPWRRMAVELLAGSRAILRPPRRTTSRYNRFQLAYCAMLTPFDRCVAAYWRYLFARFGAPRSGLAGATLDLLQRLAHGTGWTTYATAEALGERLSDALENVARTPVGAPRARGQAH